MEITLDEVLASLSSHIGNRNPKYDLSPLNGAHAPNSWTILDRKAGEVWKVIKPKVRYAENAFLEKDAIDRIPNNDMVVRYLRQDKISASGIELSCLVFPFIEATPLDNRLKVLKSGNKKMSDAEILSIGKQLVQAIEFLFATGVVHQDIKPGNILLKDDGKVMLVDLGIAKFVDADLKSIKSMKGPYAYLSPERLEMIIKLTDSTKRKVSFASDLFSLGMVLFELCTLSRLVDHLQPGELSAAYKNLGKFGINGELEKLISYLLHESPLERQRFSEDVLGSKWFNKTEMGNLGFWIQHSSNGFKFIEKFLDNGKQGESGVVLSVDQMRSESSIEKNVEYVKKHGRDIVIDPCTYRLAFPEEHHSFLTKFDYWMPVAPSHFLSDKWLAKGGEFVSKVLSFQLKYDPNFVISPYFVVDGLMDERLEMNFQSHKLSKEFLSGKESGVPLHFGLVLSERLVSSWKELEEVLVQILFTPSIENIYLRIESKRDGSHPSENAAFLENLKRFVLTLSSAKSIFWAFADLSVLGYLGFGLDSFSINPDFQKRKSDMGKLSGPKTDIKAKTSRPRYFAQRLLNDVLSEVELFDKSAVVSGADRVFGCNCPHCFKEGKDNRLDKDAARGHFLHQMGKYAGELNQIGFVKRKPWFHEKLNTAEKAYRFLEVNCNLKFSPETDGSFIPIWRRVFD